MLRSLKPARWHNPLFNRWTERENERTELAKVRLKLGHYRASLRHSGTAIEHRNHVIRALTSFTYQANKTAEPSALLELALSQALKTSNGDAGAIVLFDQETDELTVGAHTEMTSELLGILTGRRLNSGATLLMPHLVTGKGALLELTEICDVEERRLLEAADLKSLASLPLQAGYRLLGALVVGTRYRPSFLPADLHGLLAIAQETAVVWESLHLRDRLWQMAETLLSQEPQPLRPRRPSDILVANGVSKNGGTIPDTNSQASFEQWLAEISIRLGASMAAVTALGAREDDPPFTLIATHGLSPRFGQNLHSDRVFPFDQLKRRNLLVRDLANANATYAFPMLLSLEKEGARSLLAVHLDGDDVDPRDKAVIIAASTPDALHASHIEQLLTEAIAPRSQRGAAPRAPGRSRHVLASASEATDDEVAMLHSAVTTVVRNAQLFAKANGGTESLSLSNMVRQELNSLLIDK